MKRHAIVRPLGLALVFAVGIAVAWTTLGIWTTSLVEQAVSKPRLRQNVLIRRDGTPVIASYSYDYRNRTYETLDGKEVSISDPENERWRSGVSMGSGQWTYQMFLRKPWLQRIRSFDDGGKMEVYWYFVHDGRQKGAGYFVGYNNKDNHRVGYLGKAGFTRTEPPRNEHFSIDGREIAIGRAFFSPQDYPLLSGGQSSMVCFRSENQLFRVDLRDRTVRALFEDPELVSLGRTVEGGSRKGKGWISREAEPSQDDPFRSVIVLGARLKDRVVILNMQGEQITSFPIPKELAKESISAYPLPDDQVLLTQSIHSPRDGSNVATLVWLDSEGKPVDRKQVTLASYAREDLRQTSWAVAALVPVPGILSPILTVAAPMDCRSKGLADSYWEAIPIALAKIWPVLIMLILMGLVLVWLCVRRQRKFAMPWTKTWAVFVFIFGLPGMLAYMHHRRWPVREACSECGRNTPRDREACAFCDTPFASPEPKGTEVFA